MKHWQKSSTCGLKQPKPEKTTEYDYDWQKPEITSNVPGLVQQMYGLTMISQSGTKICLKQLILLD